MISRTITIRSMNIQGAFIDKIHLIKSLFASKRIDIIILQETWLEKSQIETVNKLVRPYKALFALGDTNTHGCVTILKPHMKKYIIDSSQSKVSLADAHFCTISLANTILSIGNWYLSSRKTSKHEELVGEIISETKNYMSKYPNATYIIGGDWNINMEKDSTRSLTIKSLAAALRMKIHIPTIPTDSRGGKLDYFMVSRSVESNFSSNYKRAYCKRP
jgi:exonuclease III